MRKTNKFEYNTHENIARNIIFIDGITRSGKGIFHGIIPSLANVEHFYVLNLLEQVIPAVSFASMDVPYARALLRTQLNEVAYNTLLCRNTNFRRQDETGIFNYKNPSVYLRRLKRKDGDEVVRELRKKKIFFPFKTHDMLVNLEHLNSMDINYYMLALFRHPIDVSYSWWKRGWGRRFGKDPRAFSISIDYKGEKLPWYCAGYEKEWLALNPVERCVRTVTDLIKRSVTQYKKAPNKSRIHLLTFEDFKENTREEMKKIYSFLNTGPTVHTARFIKLANCPEKLKTHERKKKLRRLKVSLTKKYLDMLMEMSEGYGNNLYGLRKQKFFKNESNYIRK